MIKYDMHYVVLPSVKIHPVIGSLFQMHTTVQVTSTAQYEIHELGPGPLTLVPPIFFSMSLSPRRLKLLLILYNKIMKFLIT